MKTKTQLVAERQVLVTLISAIIGAAADEQLADAAGPFARGICRHFAMLFAAGAQVGRLPLHVHVAISQPRGLKNPCSSGMLTDCTVVNSTD